MAEPSYSYAPVSVIGSQFMAPFQLDVIVDTTLRGNIVITDMNHKILLKVKPCDTSFRHQRVLVDADDKPIAMIREKLMTLHGRWSVFRGESESNSDIIFSAKIHNLIQFKTGVDVFLENKTSSADVCDFKMKGSWSNRNCTIFVGDTSTPIAQMSKMQSSKNMKWVEGKFMVTIYPKVDYAFVVTLIAIVEAMKMIKSDKKKHLLKQLVGGDLLLVGHHNDNQVTVDLYSDHHLRYDVGPTIPSLPSPFSLFRSQVIFLLTTSEKTSFTVDLYSFAFGDLLVPSTASDDLIPLILQFSLQLPFSLTCLSSCL
ncbi:unnamed protein product [Lactuca virosa]|uniref:Uncharacterized protein n=1 Tax=Lactuca virosa TaxID=75947 RepID=A0AAU9PKF8_9ASTR|nr:unnamed protein product [Lactuca virosa]